MISLDQIRSLDQFQQFLERVTEEGGQKFKVIRSDPRFTLNALLVSFESLQNACQDPKKVHEVYQALKRIQVDSEHQNDLDQRMQSLALKILDCVLLGYDEKGVRANLQFLRSISGTVFNIVGDLNFDEVRILPIPCMRGATLQHVVDYVQGSALDENEFENHDYAFQYFDIDPCQQFFRRHPEIIGPEKWREWGLQEVSETNAEAFALLSPAWLKHYEFKKLKQRCVIFRIPPNIRIESLLELFNKKFPSAKILGNKMYLNLLEERLQGEWVMMTERVIPGSEAKGTAKKEAVIKRLNDLGVQYDLPTYKQLLFFLMGHLFNTGEYLLQNHMVLVKDLTVMGFGIGNFSQSGLVIRNGCPDKFAVAACTL
jgi:hypothetical protein